MKNSIVKVRRVQDSSNGLANFQLEFRSDEIKNPNVGGPTDLGTMLSLARIGDDRIGNGTSITVGWFTFVEESLKLFKGLSSYMNAIKALKVNQEIEINNVDAIMSTEKGDVQLSLQVIESVTPPSEIDRIHAFYGFQDLPEELLEEWREKCNGITRQSPAAKSVVRDEQMFFTHQGQAIFRKVNVVPTQFNEVVHTFLSMDKDEYGKTIMRTAEQMTQPTMTAPVIMTAPTNATTSVEVAQ